MCADVYHICNLVFLLLAKNFILNNVYMFVLNRIIYFIYLDGIICCFKSKSPKSGQYFHTTTTSVILHLLDVSRGGQITPTWCKNTLSGVYLHHKCKFTPFWCKYRGKIIYTHWCRFTPEVNYTFLV